MFAHRKLRDARARLNRITLYRRAVQADEYEVAPRSSTDQSGCADGNHGARARRWTLDENEWRAVAIEYSRSVAQRL